MLHNWILICWSVNTFLTWLPKHSRSLATTLNSYMTKLCLFVWTRYWRNGIKIIGQHLSKDRTSCISFSLSCLLISLLPPYSGSKPKIFSSGASSSNTLSKLVHPLLWLGWLRELWRPNMRLKMILSHILAQFYVMPRTAKRFTINLRTKLLSLRLNVLLNHPHLHLLHQLPSHLHLPHQHLLLALLSAWRMLPSKPRHGEW